LSFLTLCTGVIGTGLFLGTAGSLRSGGPVGLLLGYLLVGTICYSVMVPFHSRISSIDSRSCRRRQISLGEMIAFLPVPGGHIALAERFVDPAFSFAMGWNYWYNWVIILPAELSAAAVLIDFWNRDTTKNPAWITICLVVVIAINMCGAGVYGEAEFIFACVTVDASIFLICLSHGCLLFQIYQGDNHHRCVGSYLHGA
jgi:yeast amino acid transporter